MFHCKTHSLPASRTATCTADEVHLVAFDLTRSPITYQSELDREVPASTSWQLKRGRGKGEELFASHASRPRSFAAIQPSGRSLPTINCAEELSILQPLHISPTFLSPYTLLHSSLQPHLASRASFIGPPIRAAALLPPQVCCTSHIGQTLPRRATEPLATSLFVLPTSTSSHLHLNRQYITVRHIVRILLGRLHHLFAAPPGPSFPRTSTHLVVIL